MAVAATGLVLAFWADGDGSGFGPGAQRTCSAAQAVDISLRRLMSSRVIQRLQREHRLNDSPDRNRTTIASERLRLAKHPLYVIIKDMMSAHLRNNGYRRIPLIRIEEPDAFMLPTDAELALNRFVQSRRACIPVRNKEVAAFLSAHEDVFGRSVVARRSAERYDAAFAVLIQLLGEFPDELESVADEVRFLLRPDEEIQRGLQGDHG